MFGSAQMSAHRPTTLTGIFVGGVRRVVQFVPMLIIVPYGWMVPLVILSGISICFYGYWLLLLLECWFFWFAIGVWLVRRRFWIMMIILKNIWSLNRMQPIKDGNLFRWKVLRIRRKLWGVKKLKKGISKKRKEEKYNKIFLLLRKFKLIRKIFIDLFCYFYFISKEYEKVKNWIKLKKINHFLLWLSVWFLRAFHESYLYASPTSPSLKLFVLVLKYYCLSRLFFQVRELAVQLMMKVFFLLLLIELLFVHFHTFIVTSCHPIFSMFYEGMGQVSVQGFF